MQIIGFNLKRIRTDKGISLREIARTTHLSPSFVSQIENGKATPSIATLKNIADALGTTIGVLIGETAEDRNKDPIVRLKERRRIDNVQEGITIELLTSYDPYKQMEPLHFTLEPNARSGASMYQHYGQEFLLVLSGTLEISLNTTKYVLKRGDSMYFNSNIPHSFRNIDGKKTEIVWVITPPSF